MLQLLTLFLTLTVTSSQSPAVIPIKDPNNITIAFGSCNNIYNPPEVVTQALQSVTQTTPDLWMWIGDAIYLDGKDTTLMGVLPGVEYDTSDATYVQSMFNKLKILPAYEELRSTTPIVGTWDDHDFAYNNAGKDFPYKQRNKDFYLDFLDVPQDSPRRSQEGVYDSFYVGEDKLIKVILLDERYNRDSGSLLSNILGIDLTRRFDDMLGGQQWAWLETQLQDTTSPYTLLVSSSQVMPTDRPFGDRWLEDSLQRLYDMIRDNKKSGVILLSGDVHYAEFLKNPCPGRVGYKNFYELTSSGMTHYSTVNEVLKGLFPNTYSRPEDRYIGRNFGLLRFRRSGDSTEIPNLVFEARNEKGDVVFSREIPYSDVMYSQEIVDNFSDSDCD